MARTYLTLGRHHKRDEVMIVDPRPSVTLYSSLSSFRPCNRLAAEALDLIRMKYLEFSGKLKREQRQTMITTFETSELYRVILMELKHGALGL